MIRSMTGFGRASVTELGRNFTVEVKSVNHRYLDMNIRMPRAYSPLEEKIRGIIKEKVKRGKVDLFINVNAFEKQGINAVLNKELLSSYTECLNEIKGLVEVKDDISIVNLARLPEVITLEQTEEDIEEIWTVLESVIKGAIDSLIDMRENEGARMKEDIKEKISSISELLDGIESEAHTIVDEYKIKLADRIAKIVDNVEVDETRIATEVAIFADKASIDEELVRLKSHIEQVLETIDRDGAIGRKLDFIIQEMNRESNTITSKSNNLKITKNTLEIKNEIEKMREQVQNIE